ncbi:MAG: methyltransferase [Candidatus Altiarchaeia archaeon]
MKKRITPDGYFITLLTLAILSHAIFPMARIIFFPFSLIGIILIIIGLFLTLWTNSLLLKNRTTLKPFGMPSFLITSGPFKFSRNPLYLGMAIALFGVNIFLGSFSPFIFSIIFIILIDRLIIPVEEKNLEKTFGKNYVGYKREVRRWI